MAARCTGPQPRDYSYKLPRKMVLGALRSALSAKVRDGELKVVQAFKLADHKTKNAMDALAKLEAGRTVLVVDNGENRNLALGMRNLKGVTLMPTREVNPYHLLGHQSVLMSRSGGAQILGGTRKMNHLRSDPPPAGDREGRGQEGQRAHAVFRGGAGRQQDAGEVRGREAVQGEGGGSPDGELRRQAAPPRPVLRAIARTGRRPT